MVDTYCLHGKQCCVDDGACENMDCVGVLVGDGSCVCSTDADREAVATVRSDGAPHALHMQAEIPLKSDDTVSSCNNK
eukprot:COSAG02_NODE_41184_length_397_cov_0.822148_1_plen_77_part_10